MKGIIEMDETKNIKPKRKTTTSSKVKRRYMDKVYSRVAVDLPKALVADFKAAVQAKGTSTAAVFREAMEKFIAENPL